MARSAGGKRPAEVESAERDKGADIESEAQELPAESAVQEDLKVLEMTGEEVAEVGNVSPPEESIDGQQSSSTVTSVAPWEPLATFTVEFQTRSMDNQTERQTIVCHQETEQVKQWSGIADRAFPEWILDCLAEVMASSVTSKPAELPGSADLTAANSFDLKITQLRAVQAAYLKMPIVADPNQRVFAQALSNQEPFLLEVTFSIVGLTASEMNQQPASYDVEVYICNRDERKSIQVTQSGTLIPEKLTYTEVLPEIRLDAGTYHLEALVRTGSIISEILKVFRLQVI